MSDYCILYLLVINFVSFFLCALDKYKAVRGAFRIPEQALFSISFLGGSLGLYLSMFLFRHKTKKLSFLLGIPLIIVMQAFFLYIFR